MSVKNRNKNSRGEAKVTQAVDEVPFVTEETFQEPEVEETKVEDLVIPTKEEVKEIKEPTPVVEQSNDKGSVLMHKVEFDLNNFAEAMDPKKSITKQSAAQWHMSLFLLIKRVLNTKEQVDFNTEWSTILRFAHKNKDGVFSEGCAFRHTDAWTGSSSEFDQYRRLVMTIILTADAKTRKQAMKDIHFETLVTGLQKDQVNRLATYYSV